MAIHHPGQRVSFGEPMRPLKELQAGDNLKVLTSGWLKANGFHEREMDGGGLNYRRWIAKDRCGGRLPFESFDDLGIELSASDNRLWFCWIVKENQSIIFVRYIRYVHELTAIWEALTGREWGTAATAIC